VRLRISVIGKPQLAATTACASQMFFPRTPVFFDTPACFISSSV
jgi:hypothetical protein